MAVFTVSALLAAVPVQATASGPAQPQPQPVGKKSTWHMGTFWLPPAPAGTASVNRPQVEFDKPCDDCWITGVVPRLVYADGSPADMGTGVMLHHFGLYDPARPNSSSQPCSPGSPVFGSGDERSPWLVTPRGFGLKVTPGGVWSGFVEMMNHSALPREVRLEADVYTLPASTPGMKAVTPVLLSVGDMCNAMEYDAPAGDSAKSLTWTSPMTGRIVWGLGHVHPGGVGVVVDNLTTGRRLCASRAGYGDAGEMAAMVTSMSACSWDSLGTVRKGDKLRVTSLYDAHQPVRGAMGLMALGIYQTDDLDGGSPAPESMLRTPDTKVPAAVAAAHGHHHGRGGMPM